MRNGENGDNNVPAANLTSRNKQIGHEEKVEDDEICIVDEMRLSLSGNDEEAVDVNVDGEEDVNDEFSNQLSLFIT